MHGKLNRQLVGLLVHEIFSFLFLLSRAGNMRLRISKEKSAGFFYQSSIFQSDYR